MKKLDCLKCGHSWNPRTNDRPLSCPSCKVRTWDSEKYKECEICKRNFLLIATHHKDGNNKNNNPKNIIKICFDCHGAIHQGVGRRRKGVQGGKAKIRNYRNNPIIIQKIKKLQLETINLK